MKFVRLFVCLVVSAALSPASAQPPQPAPQRSPDSVAAIVNGEIITRHDLDQRTKLALLSSNLPDGPDMRSRVEGALLRRLIDEDLKIQAATKEKVSVTAEDIVGQMQAIEEQNHLAPGGLVKLLTSKGIETEAMRQQVRADIAWARLVHQVLVRRLHISENAVSTRLEAIKANLGKPEYHASEIFLSLDNAKNEAEVHDLAERLTEQMHQGAPFGAIARQFNQAGSPDGDLGWLSEGMMDGELMRALTALQPNEVTAPIRTTEGYYILTLMEKRKVGEGIGGGAAIDLMIIDLNSIASAGQAERDLQMQHLRETLAPAKNCDDLTRLSKQAPSASISIMERLPEAQVPTKVVPLIKNLQPGQISEPIDEPKGRRFFAVCATGAGNSDKLPSADDIRRQMEDEQLELVARRYLLDLHGNAVVDIRT